MTLGVCTGDGSTRAPAHSELGILLRTQRRKKIQKRKRQWKRGKNRKKTIRGSTLRRARWRHSLPRSQEVAGVCAWHGGAVASASWPTAASCASLCYPRTVPRALGVGMSKTRRGLEPRGETEPRVAPSPGSTIPSRRRRLALVPRRLGGRVPLPFPRGGCPGHVALDPARPLPALAFERLSLCRCSPPPTARRNEEKPRVGDECRS